MIPIGIILNKGSTPIEWFRGRDHRMSLEINVWTVEAVNSDVTCAIELVNSRLGVTKPSMSNCPFPLMHYQDNLFDVYIQLAQL